MPQFFYNRGSRWLMHRSSCQQRHMSKPICLGFELTEAISFLRVKKTQMFSHCSTTHSALLLLLWASHTWSNLPLRTSPLCCLHRRCTVKEVSGTTASSSSSTNHHRCSVGAFFLHRCSVQSACTVVAPPLHRTVEEVVPMPLLLALPLFNPVPLYIYFYVLGCFWILLDLIFCIVCVLLYFQSWI